MATYQLKIGAPKNQYQDKKMAVETADAIEQLTGAEVTVIETREMTREERTAAKQLASPVPIAKAYGSVTAEIGPENLVKEA